MQEVAQSLDTKIYKSKIRQAVAVRESQYLELSLYDILTVFPSLSVTSYTTL